MVTNYVRNVVMFPVASGVCKYVCTKQGACKESMEGLVKIYN